MRAWPGLALLSLLACSSKPSASLDLKPMVDETRVVIRSTLPGMSAGFDVCFFARVAEWRFKAPPAGLSSEVAYPFIFNPAMSSVQDFPAK